MNPDNAVVLNTYSLLSSAESAGACLTARGIECVIQADDCGGMLSPLDLTRGVALVVDADDEAQARELLASMEPDTPA
jgi:hypothetical protein